MSPSQVQILKFFKTILYENIDRIAREYTPDRIPFKLDRAYVGRGGKKLKVATSIAFRCHEAVRNHSLAEYAHEKEYSKRTVGRNLVSSVVRPLEKKHLTEWAEKAGLLLDNDAFEKRWREQGEKGETEHRIFFDEESQRWFKKNNLSYHSTYLDFFYRLALHNEMFPESAYALEGFVKEGGGLYPITSQPHARATGGASKIDVEKFMSKLGYEKIPGTEHDYINRDKGIRLEDMHDENVLMDDEGNFFVIDPVIYLDDSGKMKRITSEINIENLL